MEDFITSLVREKMDFVDTSYVDGDEGNETVVRSNRILLTLGTGRTVERIAVRAQTMHLTLLLASRIMFSYYKNGFFKTREQPYDWQAQWDSILSSHERNYNPNIWACIYINGDPIFRTEPAPYMDVVERCALVTPDNYDIIHTIVEKALNQLGKTMRVTHATNVASTFHDHDERMKCGILHRIGGKSNAINFTATGGNQQNRIVHTLSTAASFLEALNLQLVVKDLQHKVRMEEITPSSVEGGKLRSAAARMMVLSKAIESFEGLYKVEYRPAKPEIFERAGV